ncbi:MAG: penicillin-binding protein 2 [Thermoleophilia bacterium]
MSAGVPRGRGRRGGWAPNLTPGGAVRIAVLGGVALALLGVLLVRLWFLQIVSEAQYAAAADSNHLRSVTIEAERGSILDRNGDPLVTNRVATNVVALPNELKGDRRASVLRRLAPRIGVSVKRMNAALEYGDRHRPYDSVVLAENVPRRVEAYVAMRLRQFPGVQLTPSYVRAYPKGSVAAHVLGTVGKISDAQLDAYRKLGYVGNETVGQTGIERQYEDVLKGTPGEKRVEVDAAGEPVPGGIEQTVPPVAGRDVKLSIDLPTERALEAEIKRQADAQGAEGAAGVALDPNTGEVLGMASYPTYDPQIFVDGDATRISRLYDDPRHPLLNLAIGPQGYPPGSTAKAITAAGALQNGLITPTTELESRSEITLYKQVFPNFRGESHGWITLPTALEVSSDTFFYQVGDEFWKEQTPTDYPLQAWQRKFGLGSPTGVDLPDESGGLVPDPPWKKKNFAGPSFGPIDRDWLAGDTIQLATGQGYMLATPLQMAAAYAAIADGGVWRTPSVGRQVTDPNGRVVQRLSQERPTRSLGLGESTLSTIRQGLYEVANSPQGTAYEVFHNLPADAKVAGKTGTAEQKSGPDPRDHSWFVGYAPADNPKIVVAVVIARGGTGANAAAPAVCGTIAAYLKFDPALCGTPTQESR